MAVGDKWKVTANSGLRIRSGPGTSYSVLGSLPKNRVVTEIAGSSNGWIHISSGYISASYVVLYEPAKVNTNTQNATNNGVSPSQQQELNETSGNNSDGSGYRPTEGIGTGESANESEYLAGKRSTYYDINNVTGVLGMPYQFLPTADIRLDPAQYVLKNKANNTGIGKEYADKIIGKMPILFMAPGRPDFMTKYSDSEKKGVLGQTIRNAIGGRNQQTSLSDLIDSNGKYYQFRYDLTEYYQYVNPMCNVAAVYLGIGEYEILNSVGLGKMNWYDYVCDHIAGTAFSATEYLHIPFYLDADTSISENFENSTGESSLASSVNGISDLGRELRFLTGYGSEALSVDFLEQNADVLEHVENVNEEIEKLLGKGNFLSNLTKHLSTVAAGGRLMFPKIWTDSDMGRSYSVKIKLVSPDCNKVSIFLNVLVPLFHLIGMVAPQIVSNNPNGYTAPFIIRALYKSNFNIDMGIITSMSVNKGGNCMWTVDGLPTSIEVDLQLKDLYEVLGITKSSPGNLVFGYDTLSNTAEMDYIANLCGINMYKPEIGRQIDLWLSINAGKLTNIPGDIWKSINQSIGTAVMNIFR